MTKREDKKASVLWVRRSGWGKGQVYELHTLISR